MTGTCPVCGVASFDLADLCTVDEETRWDRICTAAEATEDEDGPVLAVYYHFFGAE
jgi:hypothetical protein